MHNAVLVVRNFLGCAPQQAIEIVNNLMTARMRQFEHTVDSGLPALFEDYDLNAEARATLIRYADELKDWMVGILNWHKGCFRYGPETLEQHHGKPAVPSFRGPTGLGTSAARLRQQTAVH